MGVEKDGSKIGGGYVGGFLHLFDWKVKSRKKLFSSKSDLPECSKQGKRSDGNLPGTRIHLVDEDENGVRTSIGGSSDFSCASSVTDDYGFTARAPGVVARLMGLDSMPTSSFSESNSTPFFDSQSLTEVSHQRKHFEYYQEHQIMYSGNLLNKEEYPPRTFMESKPQKVLHRPIEKFQTEVLPPKSAKSIPITQHKLFSPIKGPGFIPSKTAAHIMEAAVRIIEPSPQGTAKAKMPIIGSSSVPLKVRDLKGRLEITQKMPVVGCSSVPLNVRDLKEKVETANKSSSIAEASRRPVESNAAKYLKGQSLNKSWNGSVDTSFRSFPDTVEGSSGSKNKGKSISLAIQAKVNVQRREGLSSSGSQGVAGQKEQSQVMPSESFKSQPNIQKSLHKKSTQNASGVLRQNNQKQNCLMDKDKLSSKPSTSNLQGRKVLSSNASSARQKISVRTLGSKTGSRKLGLDVMDIEKGSSNCSTKNIPRKKRAIDGNLHIEKTQFADNMLINNSQKSIESNPVVDRKFSWAEESKRKGMDVVSFTFTAPLTRSMHGSETPGHIMEKNSSDCMDNRGKRLLLDSDNMKLASVGCNVIGGDALSTLLEQKLRELTKSVESSLHNNVQGGSASHSASVMQDLALPPHTSGESAPRLFDNEDKNASFIANLGNSYSPNMFPTDISSFRSNHIFQGVDEMAECGSKLNDSRLLFEHKRPSPISVLESSFLTESSSSFDSMDSSCAEGSKQCSSILGFTSSKKFNYVDADMDLSDSASSTSTGTVAKRRAKPLTMTNLARATNWEVDYIKKILCNLEMMFQDFVLGWTSETINPYLFSQLETDSGNTRLERKLLFDCVSECLDLRCSSYAGGGYTTWVKGMRMVRRKDWLAEELNREILAWRGMGDCMVDELVDKDMSSQYGRWLNFEVDACVLGAEIESQIFTSLVDEAVVDILQL